MTKNRSATIGRINGGIILGSTLCLSVALFVAMAVYSAPVAAQDAPPVNLTLLDPPQTTPRRPMPEDRFAFRGEHAGVIYAPRNGYVSERFCSHYHQRGNGGGYGYAPYPAYQADRTHEQIGLGASYEIVTPSKGNRAAGDAAANQPRGRYELQPQEEVVPGEYVEVYHPAVYRIGEDGQEQLAEKEELTRVPKVRIVLRRVWVEGSAGESGEVLGESGPSAKHSALPAH